MCELNISKYVQERERDREKEKGKRMKKKKRVRLEQHTCMVGSDDDDGVRT